jgi:tetratricopeptide (TPR) repeat protein
MGYVLYLQGQPSEAEKTVRRGLEADASLPEGHAILGMALLQLNRVEEAEKSEREALLRNPNFAQAYLVLSEICARRQNYRQEVQDLDTYLKLQPTGAESERAQHTREATLAMLAQANPQN